jgi:hypothetical protein
VVTVASNARQNPTPMRAVVILACIACAIVALGLAFTTLVDVSMAGFPDGHVTDYAKAVDTPLRILGWVAASFGVLFLALACTPIGTRVRGAGLLVALVVFAFVAIVVEVGVPWYFGTHLDLDNGIGG